MSALTITLNPSVDKTFRVDRVVPERKLHATDIQRFPGGGGINVARVACRLGAEARALWTCGGPTGALLADLLDGECTDHVPVQVADDVRENLIVDDVSSDQQFRFGLPGPELTAAERQGWIDRVRELAPAAEYVVFSGSLPPGVPLACYRNLLEAAAQGSRLVVDTKRDALGEALDLGVYLAKPNHHELEELLERDLVDEDDIAAAARDLIDHGAAEVVLVSLGGGGALLATAERVHRYSAPAVHVRSKVGAGDSMVGGLLAGLLQGRPLTEAAKLGVAAGTAAVMTPGTELCRREDTERLMRCLDDPERIG